MQKKVHNSSEKNAFNNNGLYPLMHVNTFAYHYKQTTKPIHIKAFNK